MLLSWWLSRFTLACVNTDTFNSKNQPRDFISVTSWINSQILKAKVSYFRKWSNFVNKKCLEKVLSVQGLLTGRKMNYNAD